MRMRIPKQLPPQLVSVTEYYEIISLLIHIIDKSELDELIKALPAVSSLSGFRLNAADFEKVLYYS